MTRFDAWIRSGADRPRGIRLVVAAVAATMAVAIANAGAATAFDSAVILQYEEIGEPIDEQIGDEALPVASVTPGQFEQHLAYLDAAGYAVWPVEKIVAHLQTGIPLPERCVAITFDGAHASVYDIAYPALKARGWPFSVFISTENVDLYTPGTLTWAQMHTMRADGVKFGMQGSSGRHLIRHDRGETGEEWSARVREDISYGRARTFEQLCPTTDIFAYPYGEYDLALLEIVLGLRYVGLGREPGAVWSGSDFGALPRCEMSGASATPEEFARRVASRPLPVRAAEPANPVLAANVTRPVLTVTLDPGDYAPEALTAFVRIPGDLELRWVDREKGILELQARDPLPMGRSLYNLSAPALPGGRESSFSRLWINGDRYPD